MHPAYALGPRIRRYRPSIHLSHAAPLLGCGPSVGLICLACGLLTSDVEFAGFGVLLMLVFPPIMAAVATFHWSAYLDLYENGLVVGRSVIGKVRPMWYSEIDPSTIRVFTKIDDVRGPHRSQIL
ncbi:MAG: hypothetical protein ACTH8V_16470, partial [Brachybacterium tyrofermentans]